MALETTVEELKRFVRFTEQDAILLRAAGPRVASTFPRIAQELHDRSREHEEAHAISTVEDQVVWLGRVFGGTYDAAYFAHTEARSRVHIRVGLPQRFVIVGMSIVRVALGSEIYAQLDAHDAHATDSALDRLLDIELAVMLEIYRGELADRDRVERESRLAAAGALVAGLAHELRNPLNGAGLHLAVVGRALENGETDEAKDAVRVVGSELRRLGEVVNEALDFARPKATAMSLLDAHELCARAVARVRSAADEANIEIESDLPAHELVFEADGENLEHVLVHLLDNAIEAIGPKGGRVTVRARREPNHVWIEVEDTGPGLSEKNAPIFDPFYSTKQDGTGLGLAVAHRLVSDHAGRIDVDSQPGRTRFRLRLPLRQEGTTT